MIDLDFSRSTMAMPQADELKHGLDGAHDKSKEVFVRSLTELARDHLGLEPGDRA